MRFILLKESFKRLVCVSIIFFSFVVSVAASGDLASKVGSNTVDVKVTAEDGATIKTYTLTVTRENVNPTITNFDNVTKLYFDGSYTITAPTSNSAGAFIYTSGNTAVATIDGTMVTIVGAGESTITATQAADGAYSSGSITATLTVNSVSVLTKNGEISTTNPNYVNKNGKIGGSNSSTAYGQIVSTKSNDGLTASTSGISAIQIKTDFPSSVDGVYWINVPNVGPKQTYCLMGDEYDGGGWMLALKATRGTTFSYGATYWTAENTLNETDVTRTNADAKYDIMNGFLAKDMMALWPDISNIDTESGSIDGLTQWSWLQNDFNNSGTKITLISKFNEGQVAYYTSTNGSMTFLGYNGTKFSNQGGFTFYGINYTVLSNARVRWGFAWNNETNQGSNDVSGGIGMDARYGNYSAGDKINCCQGSAGINRSSRVEIFIR
jgi:hypothetical protein